MSTYDPIATTFAMQRESIKQFQRAVRAGAEMQRQWFALFAEGVQAQQRVQERTAETTQQLTTSWLDAAETATETDMSGVKSTVDEGFETIEQLRSESWDAARETVEESAAVYDRATEDYLDQADESFDAFLDAHERVETQVATVTDTVDAVTEPAE